MMVWVLILMLASGFYVGYLVRAVIVRGEPVRVACPACDRTYQVPAALIQHWMAQHENVIIARTKEGGATPTEWRSSMPALKNWEPGDPPQVAIEVESQKTGLKRTAKGEACCCAPGVGEPDADGVCYCDTCGRIMAAATIGELSRMVHGDLRRPRTDGAA